MSVGAHEALLEPLAVGEIQGAFYVPGYQRGYRWGEHEVTRLLDDVWTSAPDTYYLQPVVVKRHGDEWELVDGQQRLTTLFLIQQYMHNEGLQSLGAGYSLRYETRDASAQYLKAPDAEKAETNIDFFHIHAAYACIRQWFEKEPSRKQYVANKFYDALFERVKVIWYQAEDEVEATTLFTRLNVGRIPLTDAELVKALLLSVSERREEVAAQWDRIEQDLRDVERWAFVTAKHAPDPTHISLLLDAIAGGPTGRDRPLFYTFDQLHALIAGGGAAPRPGDPEGFWNRVLQLHAMVMGWYADRTLFHKVGYLVATKAADFGKLVDLAATSTKSAFAERLDALIADSLALTEAGLRELTYGDSKASLALLLMNVETIRRRKASSERYSFAEHARGGWSLEHIHAQNSDRLSTAEQWAQWLRLHSDALASLASISSADRDHMRAKVDEALEAATLTEVMFRPLERELTELFTADANSDESIDSIANLALLDGGSNAALSNSVFAVKRREVLRLDRDGAYIPVCTRNVFLKYYSPTAEHQLHFWSSQDREHYLSEMADVLSPYLTPAEATV